tara:strand:- start:492 stop:971 length:480 start_codon:yes stop_codon:yes gene_type:complete
MPTAKVTAAFDPLTLPAEVRNPYPAPYDTALNGKSRRALGDANGLTQFGVNLTELAPGAVSALRHWHSAEDEFIYITDGTPTLVTETGEQVLAPGMCACFPAGAENAHVLENRSDTVVRFIEVGTRSPAEEVHYPDNDMVLEKKPDGARSFRRMDGTQY